METQNLNSALSHIQLLSDQLDSLYQDTKVELRAIADWEEDQEFSILGVIELFSNDIQGYSEQVQSGSLNASHESSREHLRKLNVFNVDYFSTWFFDNLELYPRMKQYVEQMDHLRLLLIEYLATLSNSIAA